MSQFLDMSAVEPNEDNYCESKRYAREIRQSLLRGECVSYSRNPETDGQGRRSGAARLTARRRSIRASRRIAPGEFDVSRRLGHAGSRWLMYVELEDRALFGPILVQWESIFSAPMEMPVNV